MVEVEFKDFENSEQNARFAESIRRKDLFIFQAHAPRPGRPIDVAIAEQKQMISAARLADAGRINAVFPYAGYSRQDRKSRSGEAITGADELREFVRRGMQRGLTCDLHSGQLQGAIEVPLDHITAEFVLEEWLLKSWIINYGRKHVTLGAPDASRAKPVSRIAERLGIDYVVIDKRRDPNSGETVVKHVLGDVRDKHVLLLDDEIAGGGTIKIASRGVKDRGAKTVWAAATHGTFGKKAPANLADADLELIAVTNTLPQKENMEAIPNLVEIDMKDLFTKAVKRIHKDKSLSTLFGGHNLS